MWKKFPELGEPSSINETAQNKVEILGHQVIEDKFDVILGHGSNGKIGRAIADAVDEQIDMVSLATRARSLITRPDDLSKGGSRSRSGGGGRGGGRKADPQTGLLGEAFVYESFCKTLPDFDVACWVSDSRRKYGIDGKGDDGLGYDFVYTDVEWKANWHH